LSDRLDARELAARTARAVDTAVSTGRELGLNVREAQVLHDAFCVVLRLAPAPVVVRVPVVVMYGSDLAALRARQVREIAVADWLAQRGAPIAVSMPAQGVWVEPSPFAGWCGGVFRPMK
jgi:hypothetical protein